MLEARTTMKSKYPQDQYSCPHCDEGRDQGLLETPEHILSSCTAYSDLRVGWNPENIIEDQAAVLRAAIVRRKQLEDKLKTTE